MDLIVSGLSFTLVAMSIVFAALAFFERLGRINKNLSRIADALEEKNSCERADKKAN